MLVYTWLDPQKTSYCFGYSYFLVPGRNRPCVQQGTSLSLSRLSGGAYAWVHSACHIFHNIRSGRRPRHWLALAVEVETLWSICSWHMALFFTSPRSS